MATLYVRTDGHTTTFIHGVGSDAPITRYPSPITDTNEPAIRQAAAKAGVVLELTQATAAGFGTVAQQVSAWPLQYRK